MLASATTQDAVPVAGQGVVVAAEPGFVWKLLTVLFNRQALMELLSQPESATAAFLALNTIVFVETGLLIGFFLPGDLLLVTAGLIAPNPVCEWHLPFLPGTLCVSAIVGDTIGYKTRRARKLSCPFGLLAEPGPSWTGVLKRVCS